MKRILTLIALIAFIMLNATACNNFSGGKETVKFVYMSSQPQLAMYKEIMTGFEKKYPQYKVKGIDSGWSAYAQKVYSMFSGGDAPDLFYAQEYFVYASRDSLLDITEFTSKDPEFNWDNFFPQARQLLDVNGKYYGLLSGVDTRVFYANKEKFERAGIKMPTKSWSVEEFSKAVKAMSQVDSSDPNNTEFGFGFEPGLDRLVPYLWSAGAEIFDNSGKFIFNTPTIKETLKKFVDLRIRDNAMPTLESMLQTGLPTSFFTGKIGMIYHGRYLVPELMQNAEIEWDIVPVPYVKKPAALMEGKIYSIAKTAKNKEGGWRLLRYMTMEEGAEVMMRYGDIVPAVKSIAYSDAFIKWGGNLNNRVFLDQLEYARPDPLFRQKNAAKMAGRIGETIWLMFMGQVEVEAGCKKIEEETQKVQFETI